MLAAVHDLKLSNHPPLHPEKHPSWVTKTKSPECCFIILQYLSWHTTSNCNFMWVERRWLTLSNILCSCGEDGAAGHRHELWRLPLRRGQIGTLTKTTQQKYKPQNLSYESWQMCAKSRKWNNANNTEFVQSSCRCDLTGAANTDASKVNAAFLSHRRTLIPAETDSGGSNGPTGRTRSCLPPWSQSLLIYIHTNKYLHIFSFLRVSLKTLIAVSTVVYFFFTFFWTEVKTCSIIHKRTQIQTHTSSRFPDQSWTKQSDYNDKGI